ncbi:MAG: ABC transporter substrate-binding protein [Coriobacteriia bacterium]|nr:ABC transporter substrate-binding protein [Coriobacteriia bacterium]
MGRKRWLRATVAALLAASLLGGCAGSGGGSQTEEEAEPYVIGVVVSLTGPYAGLGDPEKKTIEMEVERINADGGVRGRDIKVLFEDDATEEAKAVDAATKLIEQDKVIALIGATGTGQTMAMRNAVDAAGIPQVSMAGGNVITAQFDPLVFATPWSNTIVVPFTLKRLKDAGITKVGLISDSGGFGKDGVAVLEAEMPKFGITAVVSETFNPGDTDLSGQLTKIKGSDAEAVLMWSAGKEAALVATGMKQLGMTIPLYGCHGNARKEFIAGAGEAAEDFMFAAGKVLIPEAYGTGSEGYAVATDFIERYTERYGDAPSTFAGHAYDALYLTVEAMRRLDEGFTPADLRDEIEATSGFVGIGGTFTFSPTDHNGMTEDDLVMYRVENGEWKLAE